MAALEAAHAMNAADRNNHTNSAVGASVVRLATSAGRSARVAELSALADWYASRGDAETAADYRAQADALVD